MCAAFHSKMKDSSGISMEVEIFSVRFEDRHRQQAFFVGIREFADGYNAVDLTGCQRYGGRRGNQSLCRVSDNIVSPSLLPGVGADASHAEDATSTFSGISEGSGTDATTAVWIDWLSAEYTVVSQSLGFRMTFGDASGGLLSWMAIDEQEEFVRWAQMARFTLSPQGEPAAYHNRVTIFYPRFREQNLSASALVEMDLVDLHQGSNSGSAPTCVCGENMCRNSDAPEESSSYVCDWCGSEDLEQTRRWCCRQCSRNVCLTCHNLPKDIVRLVLLDIRWARGTRSRDKRARRQRPSQAGLRGRPSEDQPATVFGNRILL
ncbi:unnamed protein product [Prorocentrum cordatum]|uniref:Uncharacterized protein n=1 Tax=Prorocentrum cordatum TaxID=2364126 RepID=A0ABN9TX21_9DINO|nr:unnamed protein product [Polarella glacialis]